MALPTATLNASAETRGKDRRWDEARRNVQDYLQALNVPLLSRILITDHIDSRLEQEQPARPVEFAMQEVFANPHVLRIMENIARYIPSKPEVDFTSMLPRRLDFAPVPGSHLVTRGVVASMGVLAAFAALAAYLY